MPLHRQRKARRILDINRLGRAVGRMAINHDPRAGAGNALAMQRVGHHLIGPHQPVKYPAFGKPHRVAQGEDLFQAALGGHAVVHAARKLANFGIEAAAHRHVNLLKAPADAQERLAAVNAGPDQGQRDGVAVAVKGPMGGGFRLAIFGRVYIRLAARQQEPIERVQKLVHRHQTRVRGQDHRQATRHLGDRDRIDVARGMHLIAVVHLVGVRDDPHRRPFRGPFGLCHGQPAFPCCAQHRKASPQGEALDMRKTRLKNSCAPQRKCGLTQG